MLARYHKYSLNFIRPGGTSRGVLHSKETYFLTVEKNGIVGYGECGLFRGLSCDDLPDYQSKLAWVCKNINLQRQELQDAIVNYPSIRFGIEQAFHSMHGTAPFELFPSNFTTGNDGIAINGLIWMGSYAFMEKQIKEKLESGFTTIKMKIGAIDFESEIALLRRIRQQFTAEEIVLRVDANGAFEYDEALIKLKRLADLEVHSIEQPIKQGAYEHMAELCASSPLPIALDEELIGIHDVTKKRNLLQIIKPQFLILKPSLLGGFKSCEEWIALAEKQGIGWWITSALESNIGLNAIAQWTYKKGNRLPQGLGTGALFSNNFASPLKVENGLLYYDREKEWDLRI